VLLLLASRGGVVERRCRWLAVGIDQLLETLPEQAVRTAHALGALQVCLAVHRLHVHRSAPVVENEEF